MEEQTKRCPKCGEIKSVNEFNKHKRDGLQSQCRLCEAIYYQKHKEEIALRQAIYKEEHKEEIAVYQKVYQVEHKEEIAVYQKVYREEHKEEIAVYNTLYYEEHKEEIAAQHANYYEEHKEELSISSAAWRKANPDKKRASEHNRCAKKKSNGGSHTAADIKRQGDMQKWMCWWQGPRCTGYCKDDYHVDHIVPLNKKGHNNPSNIVISCLHCNLSKQDKLPEEWIGRLF